MLKFIKLTVTEFARRDAHNSRKQLFPTGNILENMIGKGNFSSEKSLSAEKGALGSQKTCFTPLSCAKTSMKVKRFDQMNFFSKLFPEFFKKTSVNYQKTHKMAFYARQHEKLLF